MDDFKKELRKRALKYFKINFVVCSILLLLIVSNFYLINVAGQEKFGWTLLAVLSHFIIFLLVVFICFTGFVFYFMNKTTIGVILSYLLPSLAILAFFLIKVEMNTWENKLLPIVFLPFFIGQIISLILTLKFIKENKPLTPNS